MQIRNFEPDYAKCYTASEAEHELTNFKFIGPGWYITKTDTLLVVPDGDVEYTGSIVASKKSPWRQSWKAGQKFWFFVYNGRNPADSFNAITNAPTRADER
jgi:hypothetical protein